MKSLKYLALATLVAFAACSSDGGTTPAPETGSITGVVTIEGTGASGVTVSLSSGATATTDGSGAYSFADVPAGAYTVSISGYPSDATFSTSAKAAVISSSGQVVSVNFDGSFIRTSAIVGSVMTADGTGMSGVTVSISGQGASSSKTTGSNGQTDPFTGLRAGSYTVTISGYDATNYTFAETSKTVTLNTGDLQIVSFEGTPKTTASIVGSLFLDVATPANGVFDTNLETKLAVANVPIFLEGSVNDTMTVLTDANGDYSFPNLTAGSYRVTYKGTPADLPSAVSFSGDASQTVTVTTGAAATVNFPFIITQQTIDVYAFLGTDASVSATPGPGVAPIKGWKIDLYDTQANAAAGGATGRLTSTMTTDANGKATFQFLRSADKAPSGGVSDNIVFARSNAVPSSTYSMNGESIFEIHYDATDSLGMAPDTFDALYNQMVVKVHAAEIDNDTLAGWNMLMFSNADTAGIVSTHRVTVPTNSKGDAYYTVNRSALNNTDSDHNLPDTLWFRLSGGQAAANGHSYMWAPSAMDAMGAGQYLMYVWEGTVAPEDTLDAGAELVTYKDADLTFAAHHETDDSTDVATFTMGDNLTFVPNVELQLYKVNSDGTETSVSGPTAAAGGTGAVTFANIPTGVSYKVHARATATTLVVLNDTTIAITGDGSDQTYVDSTLAGSAGASSFAYKFNNGGINGTILSADGSTPVAGLRVMIQATADNIQPNALGTDSTVVKTRTTGYFTMAGMREGPYTVSVEDSTGVWSFLTTLDAPAAGDADNIDAHSALRDVQSAGNYGTANFQAYRMDTKISGLVFNDRDKDNTQDPSDALSGAVLELYQDNSGAVGRDTLVTTATTDANGAYSFTGLREGQYMVRWSMDTPDSTQRVLRALTQDSVIVTTTAAANVGSTTPATLPEWDYATTTPAVAGAADFLFLAKNTIAKGIVKDNGTGDPIEGMTVSLRRCNASAGPAKPPAAGTCTTYLGTTQTTTTDATGAFEFDNLEEGVYQISPQPGTVGTYTTSVPADALYLQQNPGDVETLTYMIS